MKMKQNEKQSYQKPVMKEYEMLAPCICNLSDPNADVGFLPVDDGSGSGNADFE